LGSPEMARRLVPGTLAAFALLLPAHARAAGSLAVLGPAAFGVAAASADESSSAYVVIRNASRTRVPISTDLVVEAPAGVALDAAPDPAWVDPGAHAVKITISGLKRLDRKVTAELIVRGGGQPVAEEVAITPVPHPEIRWALWIVVGSLAAGGAAYLAVALVVTGWLRHRHGRRGLAAPAPGPKWSFADSWSTNLTTVGAALGTVLGAATFPDTPHQIDKESLVRLNVLFGLLVVAAPFLFHVLRSPRRKAADDDSGLYGWNATLLLASSLTLAAVLGELLTLALLSWELLDGGADAELAVAGAS